MDYAKDIEIDQDALDVEWLEQPKKMFKYARLYADAKRKVDYAKEKIEVVKAQLDKEMRKDPDKFELEKTTDAVVANAIVRSQRYIDANGEYIEAKFDADLIRAALQGMEQRKDALENLVRLFGQQYFAGPSVPRDLSKEWARKQAERDSDAGMVEVLKRKKKAQ